MTRISSLSERPGRHGPRRLVDWLNPAGERKVHSLVDDLAGSFLDPSCDTFVKAAYGKTVRAV